MFSIVSNLINLTATGGKIASSGFGMVDDARYQHRLATCGSCENGVKSKSHVQCKLCGCNMLLKAKFTASNCPISEDW